MSSIVGVHDPSSDPRRLLTDLERMLARVRVPGVPMVEHELKESSCGVATQSPKFMAADAEPARGSRYSVLLLGEVFNARELRCRLSRGPAPSALPSLLAALLDEHGLDVIRELDGFFVLCVWDGAQRELHLITDRFGFRSVFWWRSGSRTVFASEIKSIAALFESAPALDVSALVELFSIGSHVGTPTWLAGVSRLAPATILTLAGTGMRTSTYWRYRYDESARVLDQETYVVNYAKLLDRAVDRQLARPGRAAIFLSGGYDSRAIAGALRPSHGRISSFTFGDPQSRDARIAPQIAQRLGLSHRGLSDHPQYLAKYCRAIAWRNEGMLPFHRTTSIQHHPVLGEHADIFLLGFLGELSGSHTWPGLLLARSRKSVMDSLFARLTAARRPLVERLFRPDVLNSAREQIATRFKASFDDIDNDHPLNIADVWRLRYLHPRTSYQATSIDRYRFEIRAPHIDAELVAFQLAIPPLARLEQRIYKKMIAYSYPALRDVPCANSETPIDPSFVREYAKLVLRFAGRRVWQPIAGLFNRADHVGREITDYAADLRAAPALRTELLGLVDAGVFDSDVFDPDAVRALTDEHYSGTARHEEMLGLLLSWGLAARWLRHGELDTAPPSLFDPHIPANVEPRIDQAV